MAHMAFKTRRGRYAVKPVYIEQGRVPQSIEFDNSIEFQWKTPLEFDRNSKFDLLWDAPLVTTKAKNLAFAENLVVAVKSENLALKNKGFLTSP